MGKYFVLQWKRLVRFLPGTVCVVLLLLGGLLAAFSFLAQQLSGGENNQKIHIALCGSLEDPMIQMGLAAVEAFDNTRFSMEFSQMAEPEAAAALAEGQISAYVVMPEDFVEEAFHGNILQLKLVSTFAASGMVSLFKEEVTQVVTDLLLEAQKGVFGMIDGMEDQALPYQQQLVDALVIDYVQYVFTRGNAYTLEELGAGNGLDLVSHLLCGFGVLFLLLACLPFAPMMIRRDPALGQMLAAKGRSALGQSLCDFFAYATALFAVLAAVGGVLAGALAVFFPQAGAVDLGVLLKGAVPVILLAAALSFLLYSLCEDLISGVLLQFFATLVLCYVSGCIYPVFFFPESIQKLAAYLPTGIARDRLSLCITGAGDRKILAAVLLYSLAFLAAGCAVRVRAIRQIRR